MSSLTEQQVKNNSDSRNRWDLFHGHRARVTQLLRDRAVPGRSRLCVLGAGNCNDLDLPALLAVFREVHLVDLDADALAHGVAHQGLESGSLRLHGGLDLTGMLEELASWTLNSPIRDEVLAACVEAPLRHVRPALPGPFDVVVSACLLSQLIGCVVQTASEQHPRFLEALQAMRAAHLRLLTDLVAPGGAGILITDIVSSDSFPSLASVPEELLPALLARLIQERNFFHGVNPAILASLFRTDPVLAAQVASLEPAGLWRWDFGPRVYLVHALGFRKRPLL